MNKNIANLEVILAGPKDIESIIEMQLAMARDTEGKTLDVLAVQAGIEAILKDPSKGAYYITKYDNQAVACMMTRFVWADWRNQHYLWLHSVYIVPEMRGKKVFRKMYDSLVEVVQSDNENIAGIRLFVDAENTHAQKVYKELGIQPSKYFLFEQIF